MIGRFQVPNDITFTDFMVQSLQGEDNIVSATLVMRREDGSIGYRCFNQQTADTLGLLRVASLSVEHDLVEGWERS